MHINISAPLNHTGYGVASRNIVTGLSLLDNEISLFPIGEPVATSQQEYEIFSASINNSVLFDVNAPYLKIWHQFDLASRIGRGKYLAFPFFELDTFDNREKNQLKVPDTIIATSKWAKDILINNGITQNIEVVPLGVDTSLFDYNKYSRKQDTNSKYIFLTIGKWEVRKCHDLLPQIFKSAFPDEQDVELWILAAEHTSSYCSAEEVQKWKEMYSSDHRIKIIPGVSSQEEIAKIISESDCGLYISRAEGWNLELLETMAMNKPVIATNYSAHTEFCNEKNSFLVDIFDTEPAFDGKAFRKQGKWAKIDSQQINQTIDYMRHLYSNKIRNNSNGIETAHQLSWSAACSKILGCI